MKAICFRLEGLVLVLALGACAVREPTATPAAQAATRAVEIGTEWVAFAVDGVDEVLKPKPTLRWINAQQISGNGGCNTFVAQSSVGRDRTLIGPLSATGKPCMTLPGAQEDLFFKALERTREARIEGDQLLLADDSGRVLARFQKAN